ncbi:MAG: carboxypeptidase-like regulatory domain-containing protein [Vicinamibacterales bacterium]
MTLRSVSAIAVCVVFLPASSVVAWAQGPPPPPPPPPGIAQPRDAAAQKPGTAKLSGRVTSLDTGRPIRRAVVRATGQALREGKSVSTDAEGRWELREIPAGRFTISVTKGGFVSLSFGQKRPFEGGKTVDVADAAAVGNLDVALPRGGALTGRVVDEFGEPVTGANVSPLRFRYASGRRQLAPVGTGDTTDDLGQYRLHGLPPGDYYVAARQTVFTFLGTSEDKSGYGQTFYPAAQNVSEASRLTVGVGQEPQNIVISLVPSRVANVSGTMTLASGKPVKQGIVMIREANNQVISSIRPGMIQDGAWSISGIAPGDYQLVAQAIDLEAVAASGSTLGMTPEFVTQPLTVTGDDITGIVLISGVGGSARGTIRFEGENPPASPPSLSALMALDTSDAGLPMPATAFVKPDWTFEMKGLTGRRKFVFNNPPAGWTLKSITVNGTDVIDTGLEVAPGAEVADVEVLLTKRTTEVSGTVQDAKGAAVADYAVVIFASDSQLWGYTSRYVRVGRADQTGRFMIAGLPAGSYTAVALDYLESGQESDPEFLERLKNLGTTLRLGEDEKKALTLKISSQ